MLISGNISWLSKCTRTLHGVVLDRGKEETAVIVIGQPEVAVNGEDRSIWTGVLPPFFRIRKL